MAGVGPVLVLRRKGCRGWVCKRCLQCAFIHKHCVGAAGYSQCTARTKRTMEYRTKAFCVSTSASTLFTAAFDSVPACARRAHCLCCAATAWLSWGSPLPQHLHRESAHPSHICTGTESTPSDICTGTGLAPPTCAPGPGSPRPHLRRYRAQPLTHYDICTGTGLAAANESAPGLGSSIPHRHPD